MEVKVLKNILGANDQIAGENLRIAREKKVFVVNVMATPGAGKTSLILHTIRKLKRKVRVGVIEGDVASQVDADIVAKEDVPVLQINTGGACHLDARMLSGAYKDMDLDQIDLLFIENVGNLICTAGYNLGEHLKIVISSVPEGDDKPYKYPHMFHKVDVVLLNKVDLKPYVKFNFDSFEKAVGTINENHTILPVSCETGEGIDEWIDWLMKKFRETNPS